MERLVNKNDKATLDRASLAMLAIVAAVALVVSAGIWAFSS
jgi:hypothetical protein